MDKDFALVLARKIGIDIQQVLREEVELIFLKGLFESFFSDRLMFKGGTALRLVYNSPRFSEDLDFSVNGKIEPKDFKKIITAIVKSDERFSITDLASKYYTHLAQIKIKETWQEIAISMKIEISRRIIKENVSKVSNLLAKSPATNISVMTKVFSLETILEDKLKMIKERKMPRDIFDIWFICEKLNKPFTLQNFGYPKGKIRQELRKFLPSSFYPVVEDLEKLNAKGL
ncbi:MAG: nucleotidyl transferase AbiEii/AbiGii toxin family protein [Candidatus Omnitrophica bacterium]|nr:nucleotidyl transferase AbiEii/AbiGii toxin family protein [Candidatus Omnitrophota bacterium]